MSKVTETVEKLALPIVEELGLEIVDIEYVKKEKLVPASFIDKENGVDIEDCGIVSEQLSEKLDEVDPIHIIITWKFPPRCGTAIKNRQTLKKQSVKMFISKHMNRLKEKKFLKVY